MIIYVVINCFKMTYYGYNVFQISQVYQKLLNSPWMPADQNTLHILVRPNFLFAPLVVQQSKTHHGAYLFLSPFSIFKMESLTHMI